MFKYKPNISSYLAEYAIKERFHPTNNLALPHDVQVYCMSGRENIYKTFLMYQRYIINNMIVDIVSRSLPDKQVRFIMYKYRDNQTFTWIANKLDVSISSLVIWNRDIQSNICNLMFYNLSTADIFVPQKIINIINILDVRIDALEWGLKVGVDVNKDWLKSLIVKRNCYRQVLSKLAECQAAPDESSLNWVVSHKCRHHNLNIDELSREATINRASIYRYLNQFRELVVKIFAEAGCKLVENAKYSF